MLFIFVVNFLFLKFSFKGINRLLSHQKLLAQLEVGLEAIVRKEEHHVVGGKLSGFVHSVAPLSSSWRYQNLLDGLEIQKVEKAQVIGNNMGISKSTDWFAHWGRRLLTIVEQKGSRCFVSGCQARDRGLVGSSLASWWSVDGRPVTVTAAATPLPAAGVPVPAVPLKPGAGFKTVSASILRARPGSLLCKFAKYYKLLSVSSLSPNS